MVYVIIYIVLGILSYFGFKKILNVENFEYIWFSIFWPATWIVMGIGKIKDLIDVKK